MTPERWLRLSNMAARRVVRRRRHNATPRLMRQAHKLYAYLATGYRALSTQ